MTKIKCLNFSGSDYRMYTTPKGNIYEFFKGRYTNIKDPVDALHFLNAAKGTVFTAEGVIKKVKESLKKAVNKLNKKPKEEVDEDNPPEETENLEPTKEELDAVDGDGPVDEKLLNPEGEEEEKMIFTEEGIKELNKKQQSFLIKKVQGNDVEIPRYEKERIKLLMELQKQGADLVELIKEYKA